MMPRPTMRLVAAGIFTLAALLPAARAGAAEPAGTVSGLNSLDTLACPSATSCVATGLDTNADGKGAVITASTGAVKVWSGKLTTAEPDALSCPPAAKKCLFVADDAVGTLTIATGALKVTATPPPPSNGIVALGTLSCPKTCYASGFEGPRSASTAILLHLSAAGKILSTTKDTGTGSGALACPTVSLCFMTDYVSPTTSLQIVKSGKIGATSHPFPADTYVAGLSCFGSSVCYALGGNSTASPVLTDELFPVNPKTGVIGTPITIGGDFSGSTYDGVNCVSATTCLVAGFTDSGTESAAVDVVTSGKAGSPADYTGQYFDAAGCASASACYAVGGASAGAVVDKVTG
jgi:hypothetical protein